MIRNDDQAFASVLVQQRWRSGFKEYDGEKLLDIAKASSMICAADMEQCMRDSRVGDVYEVSGGRVERVT
jgi:hypothetical protein